MIYLILYILCWAVAGVLYLIHPEEDFLNIALLVHLVLGVGFFGFFNFVGHFIFSEKVAKKISWVSNGFQKELGLVSLGTGICGVLCYWVREGFWWATAIPFSVFLIGAGVLHIIEIVRDKNYNPGNVYIILPDFLMPLTLLGLLLVECL